MKIIKLEKRSKYQPDEVIISLDIRINKGELNLLDYHGFDLFPDYLIPDLLVTIGKKYKGYIKNGRIKDDGPKQTYI